MRQPLDGQQVADRQWIAQFVHMLYEAKDVRGAFDRFVRDDYIQHSPGLADGPAAAVQLLVEKFADPTLTLQIKRVIVDDDMVVVLIHGEVAPTTRFAVVDIYRIDGAHIVEHWDVKEVFPAVLANDHPFFS